MVIKFEGNIILMIYNRFMEKELKEYGLYIEKKIAEIKDEFFRAENQKDMNLTLESIKRIQKYHYENIRNFQHERQIHLIVTIFFGCLALLSVIAMFVFTSSIMNLNSPFIYYSLFTLSTILIILETFYIKHYYFLENGTQRLYKYSKEIYELLDKNR